ncbi:hypothetical protein [Halorubrum vacuolatum]|uniref:Uncharacterized protein n=1 Tax=Halorubrum vacuolatum TaxID=63740 RepID=A0A238URG6_HALVU|nr:hypothetical protein [Halorubrum vacuolatum]SNR24740.1 hypothetical protein SAMN06264855_101294 [Halorubrum vacuolatum]
MRLKPVPEPPDTLAGITPYRDAVPLVPGRTDDCCARLCDRTDLDTRQVANDWLAFLDALELVESTPRGFKRTDADLTPEGVRRGLRERVLFAPEALALLGEATREDPVTAADVFAATRDRVPRHDRARDPDWETSWLERAERLLGWLTLVDLAERVTADADGDAGYVAGDAGYVAGDAY